MKIITPLFCASLALLSGSATAESYSFNLKQIIKNGVKEGQQSEAKPEQEAGIANGSTSGYSGVPAKARQEGVVLMDGLPRQGSAGLILDSNSMVKYLASIRKPDVGGVSLGMNINEALPVVKKLNAGYRFEQFNSPQYGYKGVIAKAGPANRTPSDQLTLYVNEAGTVWLVARHIELPDNQSILLDTFRNTLLEKYDAPNMITVERARPTYPRYAWSYDVNGQQYGSHSSGFKGDPCIFAQSTIWAPVSPYVDVANSHRNTCAIALVAAAYTQSNNNQLINQYNIILYSPLMIRDVNAMNARQAEFQKQKHEAEEKARSNKPQL